MQYCLYDNPNDFASFITFVETDTNLPSTQMTKNADAYQSYSLQIVCDVTHTTVVGGVGAGCCLMDASGKNGGGYCMIYSTTGTPGFVTYYLTNAQFLTSISTGTLSSSFAVTSPATSADVLYGFEYFKCSLTGLVGTCNHF